VGCVVWSAGAGVRCLGLVAGIVARRGPRGQVDGAAEKEIAVVTLAARVCMYLQEALAGTLEYSGG
jgi:hypothetical protein